MQTEVGPSAAFADALQKRAPKLICFGISGSLGNLKAAFAQMNNLQELTLPWSDLVQCPAGSLWCKNVTFLEVREVSGNLDWLAGMENLQTLSLEWDSAAGYSKLQVLQLLPKLCHLKLERIKSFRLSGVHLDLQSLTLRHPLCFSLSEELSPNLQRLSLYQPVCIHGDFCTLFGGPRHLKELQLDFHSGTPSYRLVRAVAKNCPELEVIEFPWCKGATNLRMGLEEVIMKCQKLKTVRAKSGAAKELLQLDQMLPKHIQLLHV